LGYRVTFNALKILVKLEFWTPFLSLLLCPNEDFMFLPWNSLEMSYSVSLWLNPILIAVMCCCIGVGCAHMGNSVLAEISTGEAL